MSRLGQGGELALDRGFDVHGAYRVWLDLKLYNDRARKVYEALGLSVLWPEWEARARA